MKIKTILETVFITEWNTTAHILKDDVIIACIMHNNFMTREECLEHIDEHRSGLVQQTMGFRDAEKRMMKTGYEDGLIQYDELYDELEKYAEEKYPEFKKSNKVNTFNYKFKCTEKWEHQN